jgi:hypothetical protein
MKTWRVKKDSMLAILEFAKEAILDFELDHGISTSSDPPVPFTTDDRAALTALGKVSNDDIPASITTMSQLLRYAEASIAAYNLEFRHTMRRSRESIRFANLYTQKFHEEQRERDRYPSETSIPADTVDEVLERFRDVYGHNLHESLKYLINRQCVVLLMAVHGTIPKDVDIITHPTIKVTNIRNSNLGGTCFSNKTNEDAIRTCLRVMGSTEDISDEELLDLVRVQKAAYEQTIPTPQQRIAFEASKHVIRYDLSVAKELGSVQRPLINKMLNYDDKLAIHMAFDVINAEMSEREKDLFKYLQFLHNLGNEAGIKLQAVIDFFALLNVRHLVLCDNSCMEFDPETFSPDEIEDIVSRFGSVYGGRRRMGVTTKYQQHDPEQHQHQRQRQSQRRRRRQTETLPQ